MSGLSPNTGAIADLPLR